MADENAKITVYGAPWCPDCRRSKKFLSEQLIRYNWVDIDENAEGRAFVEAKNNGKRIIPTILFEDGSLLVEPSNAALAKKLGLQTQPKLPVYDLVIIGGGPCGLTAAIYAAREGIDTLVIERSGASQLTSKIFRASQKEFLAQNSRSGWCSRHAASMSRCCRRRR